MLFYYYFFIKLYLKKNKYISLRDSWHYFVSTDDTVQQLWKEKTKQKGWQKQSWKICQKKNELRNIFS